MVMSREEFISLLTPKQIAFFSAAIRRGINLYADPNLYNPKILIDHDKSLRAHTRNRHIIGEARRQIAEDMSLGIVERNIKHRTLFLVSSRVYVSFKRLDENLRGHNYQTRQARRFNLQLFPRGQDADAVGGDNAADVSEGPILRPSLWTPSVMPSMINVWAGYQTDETETQFAFYMVCPDGDENAWEWPLLDADIAELVTASRPSETAAATKAQRRRVNPRPGAMKKQATDGTLE